MLASRLAGLKTHLQVARLLWEGKQLLTTDMCTLCVSILHLVQVEERVAAALSSEAVQRELNQRLQRERKQLEEQVSVTHCTDCRIDC
jgi:hypothetical protein